MSEALYVQLAEEQAPILSEVSLRGKSKNEVIEYVKNPRNKVSLLTDAQINKIVTPLQSIKDDIPRNVSEILSLEYNKRLAEQVGETAVREALETLSTDVLRLYDIFGMSNIDFNSLNGGAVDFVHPLTGARTRLPYTSDIRQIDPTVAAFTGAADTYHYPADELKIETLRLTEGGQSTLIWRFYEPSFYHGRSKLISYRGLSKGHSDLGALLCKSSRSKVLETLDELEAEFRASLRSA